MKVKGLFWLLSTTAGITINSAITITEICLFLDEDGNNEGKFQRDFIGFVKKIRRTSKFIHWN